MPSKINLSITKVETSMHSHSPLQLMYTHRTAEVVVCRSMDKYACVAAIVIKAYGIVIGKHEMLIDDCKNPKETQVLSLWANFHLQYQQLVNIYTTRAPGPCHRIFVKYMVTSNSTLPVAQSWLGHPHMLKTPSNPTLQTRSSLLGSTKERNPGASQSTIFSLEQPETHP